MSVFTHFSESVPSMHSLSFVFAFLWSAYVLSDPDPQDIHIHLHGEDAAHKGIQTQKVHKALIKGSNRPTSVKTGSGRLSKKQKQKPGYGEKQKPGYGGKQKPGYGGKQKPGYDEKQKPGYGEKQKPGYGGKQNEVETCKFSQECQTEDMTEENWV